MLQFSNEVHGRSTPFTGYHLIFNNTQLLVRRMHGVPQTAHTQAERLCHRRACSHLWAWRRGVCVQAEAKSFGAWGALQGGHIQPLSMSDCCCCCCLCVCRLANWEVRDMLHKVEEDLEEAYSDSSFLALELLHKAAFSGGLANGSYPDPASLHGMTGDVLREYVKSAFTASNMAVTAVGVPLGDLQRVSMVGVVCASGLRVVEDLKCRAPVTRGQRNWQGTHKTGRARMVDVASNNTGGVLQLGSWADGPVVVRRRVPLVLQLVTGSWELTLLLRWWFCNWLYCYWWQDGRRLVCNWLHCWCWRDDSETQP
jgi:hypothetical protein